MKRVSPFEDLSDFTPKHPSAGKPSTRDIDQLANDAGFPSRNATLPKHEPYRYRTGRTEQISVKGKPETKERFHRIAAGRPLGLVLDLALDLIDAVERKDAELLRQICATRFGFSGF